MTIGLHSIYCRFAGKSSDGKASYTYVNTRGINFRGGLGKQLTFLQPFSKVKVFADYFNRYAESILPDGGTLHQYLVLG
jgi:hypothetical protein